MSGGFGYTYDSVLNDFQVKIELNVVARLLIKQLNIHHYLITTTEGTY